MQAGLRNVFGAWNTIHLNLRLIGTYYWLTHMADVFFVCIGVFGIAKNVLKKNCFPWLFLCLGMPTARLLMVLVQFRDHFITDTFVILLIKSGLRFALGLLESAFSMIFSFWAHFPW